MHELAGNLALGPQRLVEINPSGCTVGLDLSPGMIALARQGRPSGEYRVHSYREPVPGELGRFDVALAVGCLDFCDDLARTLGHLSEALKPGRRLLFTVLERHHLDERPAAPCPDGIRDEGADGRAEGAREDHQPELPRLTGDGLDGGALTDEEPREGQDELRGDRDDDALDRHPERHAEVADRDREQLRAREVEDALSRPRTEALAYFATVPQLGSNVGVAALNPIQVDQTPDPNNDPLDTYLVTHPEMLIGAPVEASVFDPSNPHVMGPHLCAAAQEQPLTEADPGFGMAFRESIKEHGWGGLEQ